MWTSDKEYNIDAKWIKNSEVKNVNVPEQAWEDITSEEVNCALTKAHKWKSPWKDKVSNFRLQALNESHSLLTEQLSEMLENLSKSPQWMTEGVTIPIA